MSAPPIPLAKPQLDERDVAAAARAILSGWVTQGPEVKAFEREFAAAVGAPHACAVSSGTTALHLALKVVGVSPGDDVVTVSHSFIATANAIRYCGARPVFVDVDPSSLNLDPALLPQAIGPRARAILVAHQIGLPADLPAILAVARARGLPVIEDAACALGSHVGWEGGWQSVGRPHADIACFSFHPRKVLTTGEGGMLTTANAGWDRAWRQWRHHGMRAPEPPLPGPKPPPAESYVELGYNYRMTDFQAAIGREQLKRLPELVERRRELAERYARLLADVPGLGLPREPAWARSNFQSYCVRLPDAADQGAVMRRLLDEGIATRTGVMCAHREPAYPPGSWSCAPEPGGCACGPSGCRRLRESEAAQDRCLILPLFHDMSEAQQQRVAAALRAAIPARAAG